MTGDIEGLVAAIRATKPEDATLRFSECIVPGKRGYRWGQVATTSPEVVRILCTVWNNREGLAAAIEAGARDG